MVGEMQIGISNLAIEGVRITADVEAVHVVGGGESHVYAFPLTVTRDLQTIWGISDNNLEDGLSTEAYNSQGFVSQEEDDGRQRAESLEKRASEIDFTLPRAAKILRRVAANLRSRSQHLFRDRDEI